MCDLTNGFISNHPVIFRSRSQFFFNSSLCICAHTFTLAACTCGKCPTIISPFKENTALCSAYEAWKCGFLCLRVSFPYMLILIPSKVLRVGIRVANSMIEIANVGGKVSLPPRGKNCLTFAIEKQK